MSNLENVIFIDNNTDVPVKVFDPKDFIKAAQKSNIDPEDINAAIAMIEKLRRAN